MVDEKKNVEINFQLCDFNTFKVLRSAYNYELVQTFKQVIGRQYDSSEKSWSFPITAYKFLHEKIKNVKNTTIINALSDEEIKTVQADVEFKMQIPYCENKDLFKNFGSYRKKERLWVFPIANKEDLFSRLEKIQIQIKNIKDKPQRNF